MSTHPDINRGALILTNLANVIIEHEGERIRDPIKIDPQLNSSGINRYFVDGYVLMFKKEEEEPQIGIECSIFQSESERKELYADMWLRVSGLIQLEPETASPKLFPNQLKGVVNTSSVRLFQSYESGIVLGEIFKDTHTPAKEYIEAYLKSVCGSTPYKIVSENIWGLIVQCGGIHSLMGYSQKKICAGLLA